MSSEALITVFQKQTKKKKPGECQGPERQRLSLGTGVGAGHGTDGVTGFRIRGQGCQ